MSSTQSINEVSSKEIKKLVIIGNGFDLAHGLQTSYKNFLDWYMCKSLQQFCSNKSYTDPLIEIKNKYAGIQTMFDLSTKTFSDVLNFLSSSQHSSITYKSNFFQRILNEFHKDSWVNIEHYYFRILKTYYSNSSFTNKKEIVSKLNKELDFLITQLAIYFGSINSSMHDIPRLEMDPLKADIYKLFTENNSSEIKYINFNYTDTINRKYFTKENDIIYIHGRVSDIDNNPIIFGYGDETDPAYQNMEDSGDNMYLEHIKSFGYFRTNNYHKLISYIDSSPYSVHIVGHSCGISDRVLLNEIFEHSNCQSIEIFYHASENGSDNFKEITQEISRHFKPQNKNLMRRKILNKSIKNIIPQKSSNKNL